MEVPLSPNKKVLCNDIREIWSELKAKILENSDPLNTTNLHTLSKGGKEQIRLDSETVDANAQFIVDCIDKRLAKIIQHKKPVAQLQK